MAGQPKSRKRNGARQKTDDTCPSFPRKDISISNARSDLQGPCPPLSALLARRLAQGLPASRESRLPRQAMPVVFVPTIVEPKDLASCFGPSTPVCGMEISQRVETDVRLPAVLPPRAFPLGDLFGRDVDADNFARRTA